jgi:hypothetical protein
MALSHSPKIVTDGLVLCLDAANQKSYPGSGTTWNDLSGSGYDGEMLNGVSYSASNGGFLVFDGVDDTVNLGDSLDIGLSDWTVSVWINSDIKHFGRLVAKNNSGADGWWICVNSDGSFGIGIDSVFSNTAIYNYDSMGWVNLVGVWNRSSFATMHLNGFSLGNISNISSKSSVDLQTSFNLRVSSRDSGGGYFNGQMSQVCIYNRALTNQEIQQNFNALRGRYGI